jgi:hypothetical protein
MESVLVRDSGGLIGPLLELRKPSDIEIPCVVPGHLADIAPGTEESTLTEGGMAMQKHQHGRTDAGFRQQEAAVGAIVRSI